MIQSFFVPRKNRVAQHRMAVQNEPMHDYDRIARIIRHLDACHTAQPDLAELAQHAGLSPFHFHRLFSSWAAITPKDFLQCLTLAHAKHLLRTGQSVLDAATLAGLSGPGRLHDLCVNLEAASPGEIKSGGEGWIIHAGFADTPFGECLLAESPRGICQLGFVRAANRIAELKLLQHHWPNAQIQRDDVRAKELATQIFVPHSPQSRPVLRALVRGSEFQLRVWRALLQVPPGALVSYGQLAAALDNPRAARAVGNAVAQNSLAYLIPCHRVIRETGIVGEYRWGSERKRAMLAWESAGVITPDAH